VTALTVPDVLRRAEQVIAEQGWCRDVYTDGEGRVCVAGAVHIAVGYKPTAGFLDTDVCAAKEFLAESVRTGNLARWNDLSTEAEVRAALLAAAQRAEAGT
jgi:hypothetical protein